MTATTTLPAPPGAPAAFAAPGPERCPRCGGSGREPGQPAETCGYCGGCGYESARFDLPPSRTHGLRRVRYEPTGKREGRLSVALAKSKAHKMTWAEYAVCETTNDWGGRSFACAKAGTPRLHNVFAGKSVACECEGHTYLTSAKANQRAHEDGGEVYPSHGCLHADSVVALLLGGWFDLESGSAWLGSAEPGRAWHGTAEQRSQRLTHRRTGCGTSSN